MSPFKALAQDQAAAVEDIIEGLFADLSSGEGSTIVVQGDPGTGKTVVAIYLLKLLADIKRATDVEDLDRDTLFSEFFAPGYRELLKTARIGFVVPQQSLRESIKKVFRKTPGLYAEMVMTAIEVGQSKGDLRPACRRRGASAEPASQPAVWCSESEVPPGHRGALGSDVKTKTQLDWIRAKSKHQIFLLDAAQRVRPADLPKEVLEGLVDETKGRHRHYPLISQLRVKAGADYVGYVRKLFGAVSTLDAAAVVREELTDTTSASLTALRPCVMRSGSATQSSVSLEWLRGMPGSGRRRRTRRPATLNLTCDCAGTARRPTGSHRRDRSKGSLEDVGSIHTVQGYDLNYAAVIIGPDLRYDPEAGRMFIDRGSYFDAAGKQNNKVLGKTCSDDDLLGFIANIYAVLLTRGIRGTYVFVCDPALREYLSGLIPA